MQGRPANGFVKGRFHAGHPNDLVYVDIAAYISLRRLRTNWNNDFCIAGPTDTSLKRLSIGRYNDLFLIKTT